MKIPSDYKAGYEKARLVDQEAADNYIAHTWVGDPVMDTIVADLDSLPQQKVHQFIHAGMEEDRNGLRDAPKSLRDFLPTRRNPIRTGSIATRSDRASAHSKGTRSPSFRLSSLACW